jgi:hypothetical protein
MAKWTDRKLAIEARRRYRRGVTPPDEIRAGRVQFRNDQAGARLDEADVLEAKQKVVKEKVKEKKPVKKPAKRAKVKKDAPKFGEHGHDFNSEEE